MFLCFVKKNKYCSTSQSLRGVASEGHPVVVALSTAPAKMCLGFWGLAAIYPGFWWFLWLFWLRLAFLRGWSLSFVVLGLEAKPKILYTWIFKFQMSRVQATRIFFTPKGALERSHLDKVSLGIETFVSFHYFLFSIGLSSKHTWQSDTRLSLIAVEEHICAWLVGPKRRQKSPT